MWWTAVVNFIKNNKGILGIVLALGLVVYGTSYVKDILHAGIKAKQDAQVQQLMTEITTLKAQKEVQAQATTKALSDFQAQKTIAVAAQKKVDELIKEHNNPSVVTHSFTSVADCTEKLEAIEVKAREDADIYINEITEDRKAMASCEDVVKKQGDELVTANKIIDKDTKTIDVLATRVATADKELEKEVQKKKFWRNTTGGSVLVILGLILL